MSTRSVVEFLTAVTTDAQLQDELRRVVSGSTEAGPAIADVARRHGHDFDVTELSEVVETLNRAGSSELSDQELDSVAGGYKVVIDGISPNDLSLKIADIGLGSNLLDPTNFGSFSG